jgi:hypothetical protein
MGIIVFGVGDKFSEAERFRGWVTSGVSGTVLPEYFDRCYTKFEGGCINTFQYQSTHTECSKLELILSRRAWIFFVR